MHKSVSIEAVFNLSSLPPLTRFVQAHRDSAYRQLAASNKRICIKMATSVLLHRSIKRNGTDYIIQLAHEGIGAESWATWLYGTQDTILAPTDGTQERVRRDKRAKNANLSRRTSRRKANRTCTHSVISSTSRLCTAPTQTCRVHCG